LNSLQLKGVPKGIIEKILFKVFDFFIGPDYQGIFKHFIRGYLIDIPLPMNLYLRISWQDL
jgi:hypothetical protein